MNDVLNSLQKVVKTRQSYIIVKKSSQNGILSTQG